MTRRWGSVGALLRPCDHEALGVQPCAEVVSTRRPTGEHSNSLPGLEIYQIGLRVGFTHVRGPANGMRAVWRRDHGSPLTEIPQAFALGHYESMCVLNRERLGGVGVEVSAIETRRKGAPHVEPCVQVWICINRA